MAKFTVDTYQGDGKTYPVVIEARNENGVDDVLTGKKTKNEITGWDKKSIQKISN